MAVQLFIENLARETTTAQLEELFSAVGEVASCQVLIDRATGNPKGFAFVEMNSVEAANTAAVKFNGHLFQGKPMKVSEAKSGVL